MDILRKTVELAIMTKKLKTIVGYIKHIEKIKEKRGTMKDGYPTIDELDKIKEWDVLKDGYQGLIDYIEALWWNSENGVKQNGRWLQLHTWGWSGNEEIWNAINQTQLMMFWRKSERGGHYYFELNKMFRYPKGDKRNG